MSTWLCAIAKNVLMSYRRKNAPTQPSRKCGTAESPEEAALASASGSGSPKSCMRSTENCARSCACVFGGLSFQEIGDISPERRTGRVTYYRGKEKLKKELEADGYEA